jgi:Fur family ferric uptake transcriptional regulator
MSPETRMTQQKKVILEELQKVTSHPTANEVYKMVREKIPNISLGTVYRNLEQLSAQGKIIKLEFAGKKMRFDGNPSSHQHVRCVRCRCMDDIRLVEDDQDRPAIEASGYKILGYHLEYFGICPECLTEE